MTKVFLKIFWLLSLLWSIFASFWLSSKPNLNLPLYFEKGTLKVYKDNKNFNLKKEDLIISIDNKMVNSEEEYFRIIKSKKPLDKISFLVKRENKIEEISSTLKPYIKNFHSKIILLATAIFLILSLIVFLSKSEDKRVKILFLFSTLFIYDSVGGYFPYLKLSFPHAPLYPFYILMIFLIPPTLLYFFSYFPKEIKFKNKNFLIILFYFLNFLFGSIFILLFLKTKIFYQSTLYEIPFYYFFFWLVLFPILVCLYYILRSKDEKETIQAKWVLYSFFLAGIFHIIIRIIPYLTDYRFYIDKSFIILIDLLFPISIIISIKKHNLFDISRLFYKTILYFFSFFFFIFLYILFSTKLASIFETSMNLSQILSTLFSILIFYPFFKYLNKSLNKIFLRTELENIENIEKFGKEIMELYSLEEIKKKIKEELKVILKVNFLEFELNKNFEKRGLFYVLEGEKWQGFIMIGEKLSEQKFSRREIKAIDNLIVQIQKSIDYCFLRQKLLEKEKLALMGTLSSVIAHEIRNPLNGMKLVISFLSQKYGEREEYKILLDEIERLNKILKDVLDWAKEVKVERQNFEIYNFIDHLYSFIYPVLKDKNIDFTIQKPQENFFLNADFEKLKQIFLNLTQNSIKAVEEIKGEIKIKIFKENQNCCFHFEDNGKGIEEEELLKIFEPFYSHSGSTGLGLFVVKKIVDGHNGKIEVSSIKNKGTRFTIWIPF